MREGRHTEDSSRRRWIAGPLAAFMLIGGAAVGIAAIVFTLFIQGTVNVGSPGVKYSTGAGVATNAGTCSGSYGDAYHLNLTWDGPFPEDTCTLQVAFMEDGNSVDMQLQGITTPAGVNGLLGGDCGKLITVGDPATPAATIDLEVDASATPGSAITLDPDTWGLEWVPATEYDPLLCS